MADQDDVGGSDSPTRDGDAAPNEDGSESVDDGAAEGPSNGGGTDDVLNRTLKRWWWQRPTIRALEKDQRRHRAYREKYDDKWNEQSRLPADEMINLGGVTLVEAFTPSTASALHNTLRSWPRSKSKSDDTWLEQLENGRAHGGSWISLGYIRRPGQFMMGEEHFDASLPAHVEAVWIRLAFLVPSIAIVCATFTFDETESDLSGILRADYATVTHEVSVTAKGRFGSFRSRLPFARPRRFTIWSQPIDALSGKRRAADQHSEALTKPCRDWFYAKFPGRFSTELSARQPEVRLIFTTTSTPFADRSLWQDAVGLGWSPGVYRSTDLPGKWHLKAGSSPSRRRQWMMTVAAKRSEVGDENESDRRGQSNWSLTQRFNDEQTTLVARLTLRALLDLYGRRLAKLRDDTGKQPRVRHPVRDARRLDTYLLTDGLDAATVTPDVVEFTSNLKFFRWDVPEYSEDMTHLKAANGPDIESELVPNLCDSLR